MPDPLAHVYDLALRALDEQERQVIELRSRLAPVLAAGGIVATLLSRPALHRPHGAGPVHVAFIAIGFLGVAITALMAGYLLLSRPLSFGADASVAWRCAVSDTETYYASMIRMLDRRRLQNIPIIKRLHGAFAVMLCGMLFAVCGLVGTLALA
jgi:hypothetical protein